MLLISFFFLFFYIFHVAEASSKDSANLVSLGVGTRPQSVVLVVQEVSALMYQLAGTAGVKPSEE